MRQRLVQLMVGFSVLLGLDAGNVSSLQAATIVLDGTIHRTTGGTTFDIWRINMVSAGSFIVDVLAYEASWGDTTAPGYFAADLNGDGELTWLDANTYFYRDTGGPILAADALVEADDINDDTPVYYNGLTAATSPVTLVSLSQAAGATDGSISELDPAFVVTMAPGSYLFLIADYWLDPTEAEAGINADGDFFPPTGFVNPITTHADYRLTLRSDDFLFLVSGNTITIAPVPLPAAVWLFGSGLATMIGIARRKIR